MYPNFQKTLEFFENIFHPNIFKCDTMYNLFEIVLLFNFHAFWFQKQQIGP